MLANRVGIIHHGHIVAEGTPEELKAEIGRPTVEVPPPIRTSARRSRSVLSSFGSPTVGDPRAVAVRCEQEADLADIIRALDAAGLHVAQIQMHEPTLDDVFLAKTGTSLEGAAEDEEETEEERERGRGARPSKRDGSVHQVFADRAALDRAHAAPARADHPERSPFLCSCSRSTRTACGRRRTSPASRPTRSSTSSSPSRSCRARSSPLGTAGIDLARDIDNGFLNRLALTPLRGWALLLGQLGGRGRRSGRFRPPSTSSVGIAAGVRVRIGSCRRRPLCTCSPF